MDPYEPQPPFGTEPFPAEPFPAEAPAETPGIPDLDAPPRMEGSEAFAIFRCFGNGVSAVKRAPFPLLLAGLLMTILDGGSGGGNMGDLGNLGQDQNDYGQEYGDDDYGYDPYSEVLRSVGEPVQFALTDVVGEDVLPPAALQSFGGPEVAAIIGVLLVAMLCVLVFMVGFWIARSFIQPGVIRLHSHILQTAEPQAFKPLFSGSDRFLHMLLGSLLTGTISFCVLLVAAIPGGVALGLGAAEESQEVMVVGGLLLALIVLPVMIYVNLGLSLTAHAVTLENRSPVDAVKRSWHLASGNRFSLMAFFFVAGLGQIAAVFVGLVLCCVGLFVTIPAARAVIDFAFTESFLLLTRGREVTGYWQLWDLKESGVI